MRNYILLAAVVTLTISCNNSQPETAGEQAPATVESAAAPATPAIAAKLDPVCEMEYDTSWTEFAVHGTDTIHFCSEHCKTAFQARPEKYTKANAQ